MFRVTVTHVKPDMIGDWMDLQRNEVIPALKKAGIQTRTMYSTYLGDNWEFLAIEPVGKFAEFDSPRGLSKGLEAGPLARLQSRLAKCIASSNSYMVTRLLEISVPPEKPTDVLVSSRYRIAAGKMDEYRSLMKSEVLPLYQKAKANMIVNQRTFGANPNDVTVAVGLSKMADLDLGSVTTRQLGPEGAAKLNVKFNGIRTLVERVVRRRVADLSF